ncbi:MAG: DNA ligase [Gammaproteobacteria bacterium]
MRRIPKAARFFVAVCCFAVAVVAAGDDDGKNNKPDFSLAKVYSQDAAVGDYWASEKYDGVRALWDGQKLVSRGGKVFAAPKWFVAGLPPVPMDGELWLGRGLFEKTSGIVRRKKPNEGWRDIRYMVFDLPAHGGVFRQRYAKLREYFDKSENSHWRVVKQHKITDAAGLEEYFNEVVNGGGEGVMLRRIESIHKAGRNDDLLKYKPSADAEAVVIGYKPGKGKYTGKTGSLQVRMLGGGDKVFNIGSGLSDAQRANPPPTGATITYQYQGFTNNGIPRFPVFLRVREDEPR